MEPQTAGVRPVIYAEGLVKRYGHVTALAGVDLAADPGTVLGLLGPNGAGKTTIVRILTTLLIPDAGRAEVAGFDVVHRPQEVRERIGLAGQQASVDEYLTGRDNLIMVGRLYHLPSRRARTRADELLARFGLEAAGGRLVKTYSGGMRRRLDLAASLVVAPPVLLLDEPTTGLDPRSRMDMWAVIEGLVKDGTTLLLTTQYLEEADRLADHIAVIDQGRVVAAGSPDSLKKSIGGERIDVSVPDAQLLPVVQAAMARAVGREPDLDAELNRLTVAVTEGVQDLTAVVRELDAAGVVVEDIGLRRPTLDEVFMTLTGHGTGTPDEKQEEVS
ncbi:MAG: ATP-binding cassette domain-containing protein [Clostridia bacterium]